MTTENISENSTESELSPENQTKYADYFEINKEESTDGNPEINKVENKQNVGSQTNSTNKEPAKEPEQDKKVKQHVPDWQRRIDKQTAIIMQQKAELEAVKKSLVKAPEKPEMDKDNFVTEKEWIKHEARLEAEKVYERKLAERDDLSRKVYEQQASDTAFKQSWVETVKQNFEGDEEGLEDFKSLTKDPNATDHFSTEIHDYIESTPLGGRLLHVLLHRDDLVDQINNAKPIAKAMLLLKLENQIATYMSGKSAPIKEATPTVKPISKAPAPIGQMDTRGASLDEEGTEKAQYNAYMKRKFGVK